MLYSLNTKEWDISDNNGIFLVNRKKWEWSEERLDREDFQELLIEVLKHQMDLVEVDDVKLSIPRVVNPFVQVSGKHLHATPELFIQLSGASALKFPKETIRLKQDGVCMVPRGMPHSEHPQHLDGRFVNMVIGYWQRLVFVHFAVIGEDGWPRIYKSQKWIMRAGKRNVYRYLDDLVYPYHGNGVARNQEVKGLFLTHLAVLLDVVSEEQVGGEGHSLKIEQCKRYVRQNLSDSELSVRKLAEWLQWSPDYLSHRFCSETGQTLSKYLGEQRIAVAKELLVETSMNVAEAARASGYDDPGYFTRVFKMESGETPKQFRQRNAK